MARAENNCARQSGPVLSRTFMALRFENSWRVLLLLAVALGVIRAPAQAKEAEDDLARRVVILANASSDESLKLARYYAERRAIPAENIVALPMTLAETISWREFVDTVYQPLQDELVRRGWIDATGSDLKDSVGRRKYAVLGHRMSYLAVCRGVPL